MKYIIFDFDGTIADTETMILSIYNSGVADVFGLEKIDHEKLILLKEKSAREVMTEMKVSFIKLPFLIWKMKKGLLKRIDEVEIFPGMKEAIEKLKEKGIKMGMVSSDSSENILRILRKYEIESFFEFINTNSSIWGKHRAIARAIKENNIDVGEAIYVGDEVRDIHACRKVGIKVASVVWGFNSENFLRKNNPDYVIEKPTDLFAIIDK